MLGERRGQRIHVYLESEFVQIAEQHVTEAL
jgi:hypothetical protein